MKLKLVILVLLLPSASLAEESGFDFLYVKNKDVHACYNIHNKGSCFKLYQGNKLAIKKERLKKEPWRKNDWIEIRGDIIKKKPYWVQTKHLIALDEFVRFDHDWPVKSFKYDFGDATVIYNFSRDGRVVYGKQKYKGYVYKEPQYLPELIQIRYKVPTRQKDIIDTYIYLPRDRKIDIRSACVGGEDCEQVLFD